MRSQLPLPQALLLTASVESQHLRFLVVGTATQTILVYCQNWRREEASNGTRMVPGSVVHLQLRMMGGKGAQNRGQECAQDLLP